MRLQFGCRGFVRNNSQRNRHSIPLNNWACGLTQIKYEHQASEDQTQKTRWETREQNNTTSFWSGKAAAKPNNKTAKDPNLNNLRKQPNSLRPKLEKCTKEKEKQSLVALLKQGGEFRPYCSKLSCLNLNPNTASNSPDSFNQEFRPLILIMIKHFIS